jgi:CHAT domain-containing protein
VVGVKLATGTTVRALAESEAMLRKIDTLVSRLDVLEEVRPRERDSVVMRQVQAMTTELSLIRGAYETLLAQAADRDSVGARLLGGRSITASEVQRALGPDEAMLEYLVTPSRVVVFVVTRLSVKSLVSDVPREDLTRRVRLARDLLGARSVSAGAREVLTGLHEILVAPVERAGLLRSVRRLVVVPHSVLAYLPYSALVQASTGRHVMEDYTLLFLPSAAALGSLRALPPAPRSEDAQSSPPGAALAPFTVTLPGSLREVRTFRRFYGRAQVTEGERATEQALRRALAAGGVVHVATHGVMNPRNPMFSRIELAMGEGGAPDNDGRLEVHELLSLRLDAKLVFLSGCDTGVGSSWSTQFARGEDYATLSLAFLYAGARTVVATLWRIGDEGAAVLAQRFYENLRSLPPAEALAAAQRALLGDPRFSSPYYWAAYQVIGSNALVGGAHSNTAVSVQQD